MIGPVIFDSNILVDHFNGIEQARHELKYHRDAVISAVTWMELMTAFEAKILAGILSEPDYAAAKSVLSLFPVVGISDAIMEETARVRGRSLFNHSTWF
jgi:predicted nucleic acid-binding protein